MWLITSNTWDGPSAERISRGDPEKSTRTIEGWVSRRPINEALSLLKLYEDLFRRRYRSRAVNFHVVGIQRIPELSTAAMDAAKLRLIEDSVEQLRADFRRMVGL